MHGQAFVLWLYMYRGHGFFSANEELLDRYASCPGSVEVIAVQTEYLDALKAAPRAAPTSMPLLPSSMHPLQYCLQHANAVYAPQCVEHQSKV